MKALVWAPHCVARWGHRGFKRSGALHKVRQPLGSRAQGLQRPCLQVPALGPSSLGLSAQQGQVLLVSMPGMPVGSPRHLVQTGLARPMSSGVVDS